MLITLLSMDVTTPLPSSTPSSSRYVARRQTRRVQGRGSSNSDTLISGMHVETTEDGSPFNPPVYRGEVTPVGIPQPVNTARNLRMERSSMTAARMTEQSLGNEAKIASKQSILDMNRWIGLAEQSRRCATPSGSDAASLSDYRIGTEKDNSITDFGIGEAIFEQNLQSLREELRYLHTTAWHYSASSCT